MQSYWNPKETQKTSKWEPRGHPMGRPGESNGNTVETRMGAIRKHQAETYGNPTGIVRMPNGIATDIDCKSNVPKEANCGIRLRANESRMGIGKTPTRTQLKSNCAQIMKPMRFRSVKHMGIKWGRRVTLHKAVHQISLQFHDVKHACQRMPPECHHRDSGRRHVRAPQHTRTRKVKWE